MSYDITLHKSGRVRPIYVVVLDLRQNQCDCQCPFLLSLRSILPFLLTPIPTGCSTDSPHHRKLRGHLVIPLGSQVIIALSV